MDRHPELKICFAHGGGTLPYQIGRLDHGFRVREECRHLTDTPYNYMRRLYFDTLTHDTRALQYLLDCVGPDHVLLGTDHPFDMGQPDAIAELSAAFADTPDIVPEAILGGNAVRLLNLPVNGHDALD
jgi:aminocarboxymuconate-semialdehyde decarboxylase